MTLAINPGQSANLLALARKEFQENSERLKRELEQKTEELINGIKHDLAATLEEAVTIFQSVPEELRQEVISEPAFYPMIEALNLRIYKPVDGEIRHPKTPTEPGARNYPGTRKAQVYVEPDDVVRFIGNRTLSSNEIRDHFGLSSSGTFTMLNKYCKGRLIKEKSTEGRGFNWRHA